MMTIGTKVKNNKIVKAYLSFSSGKKIELTFDEWEEFEQKLAMIKISGMNIKQDKRFLA